MNPSTLRGLVGRVLVVGVRGQSSSTARYKVLGFGLRSVRVQSVATGQRSEIEIDALERALDDGTLTHDNALTTTR